VAVPKQKPHKSKQDYATPPEFIRATLNLLSIDRFAHDFAADKTNMKALSYWTQQDDSLSKTPQQWADACAGGWGWLNSPYDDIGAWARLCTAAKRYGASIATLWPAGIGSNWFRDYVNQQAFVFALNGRLCFIEDWATQVWDHNDPSPQRKYKKGDRVYKSKPLYPKDCILTLYAPAFAPGFDVWSWQQ
jgi:hypothetical protein